MRAAWIALVLATTTPVVAQPAQPEAPPSEPSPEGDPTDRPLLRPAHKPREIVIEVPGARSPMNKLALAATLGAGLVASGIGVYFHLDSRSASDDVEAVQFEGEAWTQEEVDLVARAERSRGRAVIGYAVGGALVIGAITAFIVTAPKAERAVIRTGASASLIPGGAMAVRTWRF